MLTEAVYGFVFSPDGRLLAATGKESVCAWDVRTGKLRYEIKGAHGRLAVSPDGHYLACGDEEAIQLFEAASGKVVRHFAAHAGPVRALAFSPDGGIFAAAGNYSISLWNVATGQRLHGLVGHEHPAASLAFAPDGASLASGDLQGGTVLVWDLKTRTPRRVLRGHDLAVLSIAYSPDGQTIATGDGCFRGGGGDLDAQIRLWGVAEGRLLRQFPGHITSVQSLAFSPDGRTLASAGHDARAKLWDAATGTRLRQIRGADSQFRTVAFSPDGKTLLIGSSSGELLLHQTDSGQLLRNLGTTEGTRRAILFAAWLPDGKTVLTREQIERARSEPAVVNEVRLWAIDSGRLLRAFPISPAISGYEDYALSPDGRTFAATGERFRDPAIQLWDTATGTSLGRLTGHAGGAVYALAFSADGKLLASSGEDTTLLLWDVERARLGHLWPELVAGKDEIARTIKKRVISAVEAVPFLKERLQCAAALEVRVNDLVAQLDDDTFAVREKASEGLAGLGTEAAFALRLVLQGSPAVEVRVRIEKLLDKMKTPEGEPEGLEPRSVWLGLAILEDLGTPPAEQALQALAKGSAKSTVVREARAACERLAQRRKRP
jgi:WD40 repeat protein